MLSPRRHEGVGSRGVALFGDINRAFPFAGEIYSAVGVRLSKQNNTLRPRGDDTWADMAARFPREEEGGPPFKSIILKKAPENTRSGS